MSSLSKENKINSLERKMKEGGKVKKSIEKKVKDFANRKTKEYGKSYKDSANRLVKGEQSTAKNIKDGVLLPIKGIRAAATADLNRLVNSKKERKAAGLNYREGGKVEKTNENPNKKLEKEGNTTKGNMGEGRLSIDALDKLMKRGKYAPVKKAKGGAVHKMPDGTMMKGAKHGMKAGGSVKGRCKVDGIAVRGRTKAKHK